nr:YibE/F family protein [Pseudonocardia endophytica]
MPVRELVEPAGAPGGPPGTGHGHGHGPATPAGKRVRILLAALLVPCALAALAGVALLWPGTSPLPSIPPQQQVHGDVQAVQAADCTPGSGSGGCTGVTVRMTDGPRSGSDLVQLVPAEPSTPRFAVGDKIVLAYSGGNPDEAGSYQITDFQRGAPLLWLAAAFAVAVLVLGRWRGLAALVALGLSFVVLLLFVLPSILSGHSPLAVAVTGAGVIMFVVLYLSHGFSARTSCAVLGTLVSLVLIGGLGALFTVATRLTGLDDTTANLIGTLGNIPIDARGLVLAGLVIGALGVLDDVTVTQASAVWELRDANPSLGAGTLFAAGMRIGRDHVSSAVNTLVLAYAGAALPLMLLFTVSSTSFGQVVTSQDVATEIVRTLVGSIGLVASVPVTTGLAAVVAARR